jgi:Transposase IS200 like
MKIWDDNEFPLAYFITFRTYGTWLHGDDRGSIDRYHNCYRGERVTSNSVMQKQHKAKLKSEPVLLNAKQRPIVEAAIREVCDHRRWRLLAINVRTNHAHIVVSAATRPEIVLKDFKAYSTRGLKTAALWNFNHSPWVDGGK